MAKYDSIDRSKFFSDKSYRSQVISNIDYNPHLHQVRGSSLIYNDSIPRILSLNSETSALRYRRRRGEFKTVIHWGQRKLLLSEIEFLTIYVNNIDYNQLIDCDCRYTCIYAGAAPGTHITFLSMLFPMIKFILIDPSEFHHTLIESDRIVIRKQFMTTSIAHELSSISNNILFISDIRSVDYRMVSYSELEDYIANDMKLQMDCHILMNPIAGLYKFRLPWDDKESYYLRGDIYLPVWGPKSTTECRLMVDRSHRVITNEKNEEHNDFTCVYDHTRINDQLFYFNNVTRLSVYDHQVIHEEMCHCYDCSSEIHILKNFICKYPTFSVDIFQEYLNYDSDPNLSDEDTLKKDIEDNSNPAFVVNGFHEDSCSMLRSTFSSDQNHLTQASNWTPILASQIRQLSYLISKACCGQDFNSESQYLPQADQSLTENHSYIQSSKRKKKRRKRKAKAQSNYKTSAGINKVRSLLNIRFKRKSFECKIFDVENSSLSIFKPMSNGNHVSKTEMTINSIQSKTNDYLKLMIQSSYTQVASYDSFREFRKDDNLSKVSWCKINEFAWDDVDENDGCLGLIGGSAVHANTAGDTWLWNILAELCGIQPLVSARIVPTSATITDHISTVPEFPGLVLDYQAVLNYDLFTNENKLNLFLDCFKKHDYILSQLFEVNAPDRLMKFFRSRYQQNRFDDSSDVHRVDKRVICSLIPAFMLLTSAGSAYFYIGNDFYQLHDALPQSQYGFTKYHLIDVSQTLEGASLTPSISKFGLPTVTYNHNLSLFEVLISFNTSLNSNCYPHDALHRSYIESVGNINNCDNHKSVENNMDVHESILSGVKDLIICDVIAINGDNSQLQQIDSIDMLRYRQRLSKCEDFVKMDFDFSKDVRNDLIQDCYCRGRHHILQVAGFNDVFCLNLE